MKRLIGLLIYLGSSFVLAETPYCKISKDGRNSENAGVAEFKKGQEMQIYTKDRTAKLYASWNETFYVYQMSISIDGVFINTFVEYPGKRGYLNYQPSGKKNTVDAYCLFE